MPTEKISDAQPPCFHPDHSHASHQVFEPGSYRHTCPACGKVTEFYVPSRPQ